MPIINITVKGKVASSDTKAIVNGNSDYAVNWVLDGEWADYDTKTMRVRFFDGSVINSIFSGTSCSLPVITETCMIEIGLFAGDLITSTPAVINCIRCIRDDEGPVQDPTPSIYDQLLAKLNELGSGSEMRVDGGYVQYSTDNGKTWVNLIAEADLKGDPGTPGTPGAPGKDGHTPVKGTDYWTASDKAEVVAEAAAAVDLTPYAKKIEVPTKTSQLTNDSGFLTSHQDISGKQDKSTLEADVAAKGFTKNTGTYSKPAGGIPKADLAPAVQTSLGKADTALQEHQSLAAYRTAAAQDVIDSGKVDKVTGKGLSSNDYTAAAKAKVDAIPANPKYTDTVYDDTALKERVATIEGKESAWDAKSDFSGSYNDLTDKPTIPSVPTATINANAAARHEHSNKTVLDLISETVKAAWDAASTWVTTNGANVLSHLSDSIKHITAAERTKWNGKQDKLIAGDNITIAADGKTISATGGGGASLTNDDVINALYETGFINPATDSSGKILLVTDNNILTL